MAYQLANVVGQRELSRLAYLFGGYHTRLPKPGAIVQDGLLHANVETPGLIIRYTTDGTLPDDQSPEYSRPFPEKGKSMLRAFTPEGRSGGTTVLD